MARDETVYGGNAADTLNGTDGADKLSGENGDDTVIRHGDGDSIRLTGVTASELGADRFRFVDNLTLRGSDEADTLTGGRGHDTLKGKKGDDTLNGGRDNDTLGGGKGNDRLTGGRGADVFAFTAGDGDDIIADFEAGDTIRIDGVSGGFAGLDIRQDGDDTVIRYGTLGDDKIYGGTGNDLL
ncbi:calcium-binding protein [Hoeflea sp.]|uniref:calcium-binding protein n=1 Tax=Hoeflea sp. TaxID=1940281 RepID=UPI003B024CE7